MQTLDAPDDHVKAYAIQITCQAFTNGLHIDIQPYAHPSDATKDDRESATPPARPARYYFYQLTTKCQVPPELLASPPSPSAPSAINNGSVIGLGAW